MRLFFSLENTNKLIIQLKHKSKLIDKTHLTVSQSFDIILIRTLDKILRKNKIERLSLKSVRGEGPAQGRVYVEISGKMASEQHVSSVSSMILKTVAMALGA